MASPRALKQVQRLITMQRQLTQTAGVLHDRMNDWLDLADHLDQDDLPMIQTLRDAEHRGEPPYRLKWTPIREGSLEITADGVIVPPAVYQIDLDTGVIATELDVSGKTLIIATYTMVGPRYQAIEILAAIPALSIQEAGAHRAQYEQMVAYLEENFGFETLDSARR